MKQIQIHRNRSGSRYGIRMVLILLAVYLVGLGAVYSAWSDLISVNLGMTTGALDLIFDSTDNNPIRAYIVDAGGKKEEKTEVTAEMDSDGKSIDFSFDEALLTSEFAGGNKMLMLQYTLIGDENNTIDCFESYSDDFDEPSGEQVEFIPDEEKSVMTVDEKEYGLPSRLFEATPNLYWDVYRQMEIEESDNDEPKIKVTVYLKLRSDSEEDLAELSENEELSLNADDLPEELINELTTAEADTEGALSDPAVAETDTTVLPDAANPETDTAVLSDPAVAGTDIEGAVPVRPVVIDAEIDTTYKFHLPLWVEQGDPEVKIDWSETRTDSD